MYVVMIKNGREYEFIKLFDTYAEAAEYAKDIDEALIFEEPSLRDRENLS